MVYYRTSNALRGLMKRSPMTIQTRKARSSEVNDGYKAQGKSLLKRMFAGVVLSCGAIFALDREYVYSKIGEILQIFLVSNNFESFRDSMDSLFQSSTTVEGTTTGNKIDNMQANARSVKENPEKIIIIREYPNSDSNVWYYCKWIIGITLGGALIAGAAYLWWSPKEEMSTLIGGVNDTSSLSSENAAHKIPEPDKDRSNFYAGNLQQPAPSAISEQEVERITQMMEKAKTVKPEEMKQFWETTREEVSRAALKRGEHVHREALRLFPDWDTWQEMTELQKFKMKRDSAIKFRDLHSAVANISGTQVDSTRFNNTIEHWNQEMLDEQRRINQRAALNQAAENDPSSQENTWIKWITSRVWSKQ